MVKICILLLLLAVTPNLHYENYATTTVQSGLFLPASTNRETRQFARFVSQVSESLGFTGFAGFRYEYHVKLVSLVLETLLWGKWGLFEPQGIQALKSSAVWCNDVARGVS